jgi:hypothetical protein
MPQPTSKEDYEARFHENQKMTGRFFETTMHMPCPFCAAPEFMVYKILEVTEIIAQEHICSECRRGCRAIITRETGGISFEFVQTQGDPPPEWVPAMRVEPKP